MLLDQANLRLRYLIRGPRISYTLSGQIDEMVKVVNSAAAGCKIPQIHMIRFDRSICGNPCQALTREWLETNARGGFACSSIVGANTRRYHGLLTVRPESSVGRQMLLSKIEERATVDHQVFDLATNQYQDCIHPRGYENQAEFRLDPWPVFRFEAGGAVIEKSVFLVHDLHAVAVSYRLLGGAGKVEIELRPLIAFRDYHSTTHANDAINREVRQEANALRIEPYVGMPALYISHTAARASTVGEWYYRFQFERERERGLDDLEDLFCPLQLNGTLTPAKPLTLIASTEICDVADYGRLRSAELRRRKKIFASAPVKDELVQQLTVAADQFLASRREGPTIMAGYPWFTDWGRDAMIALPGLTLVQGRGDVGKGILRTFAGTVDQGMIPNHFPEENGRPEFNSVDATLWYFEAVRRYVEHSGDQEFARELYQTLAGILDWHVKGTRYNIHMLESCLLYGGEAGVQLTWMDAKIGDHVVTPRRGCAVEIQALWYNALMITADLARRFKDRAGAQRFESIAKKLKKNFLAAFWNEAAGCLYDVVDGDTRDASLRPNQVFAVSLGHSMLPAKRATELVKVVREHLLTPFGLRTLSPSDANYHPRYEGGPSSRDSAYHQGTVWPWLLGPFVTAFVKVNKGSAKARAEAKAMLDGFRNHLEEAGVGQVSEIFDGDAPHSPRGCFAQAWSVGELLRALCEEVHRPSPPKPAQRNPKYKARRAR